MVVDVLILLRGRETLRSAADCLKYITEINWFSGLRKGVKDVVVDILILL